jgi:hypothetical protein
VSYGIHIVGDDYIDHTACPGCLRGIGGAFLGNDQECLPAATNAAGSRASVWGSAMRLTVGFSPSSQR